MRGVVYITTFLRGKIDRMRMLIKKARAATLLQKTMRRYLVTKQVRFIKCEQAVTSTLCGFIDLTAQVRDQS